MSSTWVSASDDPALLACVASAWTGDEDHCRWCDGQLPKRRTRWCSNECSNAFTRNHMWSSASLAAKRRDEHMCIECHVDPRDARDRALTDGLSASAARRFIVLQVHHKTPVLGRHGTFGCHHHLEGLETVCLHHHLERHHGAKDHQLEMEAA